MNWWPFHNKVDEVPIENDHEEELDDEDFK